jgi:hypothetical protein
MPDLQTLRKCKSCSNGRVAPSGSRSLSRLSAEYVDHEDGLAPANFALLTPLKRSAEYGRLRDRIAQLKPTDAWSLDNQHYFVFALARMETDPVDAEAPSALFVVGNDETVVSALVIRPGLDGAEAQSEDLRVSM